MTTAEYVARLVEGVTITEEQAEAAARILAAVEQVAA